MKMIELSSLRELHAKMKAKKEYQKEVAFQYKGKEFIVLFMTNMIPYKLKITYGENKDIKINVEKGYRVKSYFEYEEYISLANYLGLNGKEKFFPVGFWQGFNESVLKSMFYDMNETDICKFGKMEIRNCNEYYINSRKVFMSDGLIVKEDLMKCFDYAFEMAYGKGQHRAYRSGGKKRRTSKEIFVDSFQGKIAEYAVCRFLSKEGVGCSEPDVSVEGLGYWDSYDVECGNCHIAIKSTKHFGQLLLLETKDWNCNGDYIPNSDSGIKKYDYFILVRIKPDVKSVYKEVRESTAINRSALLEVAYKNQWEYDLAGYITNQDLKDIIKEHVVIPQGALLNGREQMDADNFYFQAGDMRPARDIIKHLLKINGI